MKANKQVKQSERSKNDEATWNLEVRSLKKLMLVLWQEVQTLESLHCMDLKNKINFHEEVRKFEIKLIKSALLEAGGNQTHAARLLGINLSNLNSKIKRYKISLNYGLDKVKHTGKHNGNGENKA